MTASSLSFCDDGELGYARSRAVLAPGATRAMDEPYRLAHLPLIAPDHPLAIARKDGAHYEHGRHPKIFSIVLPIPAAALEASPPYKALLEELRASPLAAKIAWDLLDRRRDKLHATICGSLAIGEEPPIIPEEARRTLREVGPFHVELRGLYAGDLNTGRLYLSVYPERRSGRNMIQAVQEALGQRVTDLYLVGLFNLIDDLDQRETAALSRLLHRWRDAAFAKLEAQSVWLLGSYDDLVLDATVAEQIRLDQD